MAGDTFKRMSLDELAYFRNGKSISPKRYSERGKYPVFGANGQIARSDDVLNTEAVVVIGRVGAYCGSVHYIPEPSWVTDNAIVATPKAGNDVRFLYYLLGGLELRRTAIGSAQPLMTQGGLKVLQTAVPPLKQQQVIACILGALDDKIELNRRMNATLEAMARAIFKSWFVDFLPVRAKMAGDNTAGGLAPHIADLFPDAFEESELGEIPKGWEVVGIYRVAEVVYGAPFKSSLFNEDRNGVPLIRIRDLSTHNPTVFTPEKHPKGYLVNPGDLVVGMDGEFRAHLWRGPQAWLNQRLCCFKPKHNVPRAFVHYSIEAPLHFFERSKTGTTVIHLGKSDIDTFRLVMPPSAILSAFKAIVEPLHSRIVSNAAESRTLASIRDTLLPKLISGELRLLDAERIVGRCL